MQDRCGAELLVSISDFLDLLSPYFRVQGFPVAGYPIEVAIFRLRISLLKARALVTS
jgi:hypothetical protein